MGKYQRNRGANFERELATYLTSALNRSVKRNIGQSRDGGDDITIRPFRIEAKRRKAFAVYEFLDQVQAASKPGEIPVVIGRGDHREAFAVVPLDKFVVLMEAYLGAIGQ